MTLDEYRRYLLSPHWKAIRAEVIARAQDRCEVCGWFCGMPVGHSRRDRCEDWENRCEWCWTYCEDEGEQAFSQRFLEVHHRTYARIGREDLGDLLALCSLCHAGITDRHGVLKDLARAGFLGWDKATPRHAEKGTFLQSMKARGALHLVARMPD